METINTYILRHLQSNEYRRRLTETYAPSYENAYDWIDNVINGNLIFSYRNTHYTKSSFKEKLHSHDFYELVIYLKGDVRYITEDSELNMPEPGDIIFSPPGRVHTAMLERESDYTRYVFYFNPDAFGSSAGKLPEFVSSEPFMRPTEGAEQILTLLEKMRESCRSSTAVSELLAYSYVIQLFCLIGGISSAPSTMSRLPEKAVEIKDYIDSHLTELGSISDLAERFFYSREHLSRYFARAFNIPIGQYITARRIELAKRLLSSGRSVTDACFDSGFDNVSFFIKVFSRMVGVTPLKYAKANDKAATV